MDEIIELSNKLIELDKEMSANLVKLAKIEQSEDVQKYKDLLDKNADCKADTKYCTDELAKLASSWQKDSFSKGKKDVAQFGRIRIYRSSRTERTIIPAKFVEMFPFDMNMLVENGDIHIPISVVERYKDPAELEPVITRKTMFKYESLVLTEKKPEIPKPAAKKKGRPVKEKPKSKQKVKA